MANTPPNDEPQGAAAESLCADADAVDWRLAEMFGRLPAAGCAVDLHQGVLTRLARRRAFRRLGALAAAAALVFLGWRVWPGGNDGRPGPEGPSGIVVNSGEDRAHQAALIAQWDKLLDEATAVPPPVVELSLIGAQREWISALQEVQRR